MNCLDECIRRIYPTLVHFSKEDRGRVDKTTDKYRTDELQSAKANAILRIAPCPRGAGMERRAVRACQQPAESAIS